MNNLGRWLGKKKPERTDRVTPSAASPSAARVRYNEEIVPLEMLEETTPPRAKAFPCPEFMAAVGIQDEFNTLCAKAGLTRLANCCVFQYERLTSIFINNFRFYPNDDVVGFRIYDKL